MRYRLKLETDPGAQIKFGGNSPHLQSKPKTIYYFCLDSMTTKLDAGVRAWCEEHLSSDGWSFSGTSYINAAMEFDNEADMIAFKLRWMSA